MSDATQTVFETIAYEVRDHIAHITLDRPDKRNAMNADLFRELGDAAERAAGDPDVHAILLRGRGPSFCAGIDLGALAGLAGAREGFAVFVAMAQRPFRALARAAKPVVAAVRGHALGAGFQLALACDIRLAAPDATFGMFEGRYGIIPDLGGMHELTRLVGPARAKELVWTTRTVDAEEAARIGLVNRLETDDLDEAAEAFVASLLERPPLPQALSKTLIDRAHETPLEVELEREAQVQAIALGSDDHREAVAAFLEKRPGRYTGH